MLIPALEPPPVLRTLDFGAKSDALVRGYSLELEQLVTPDNSVKSRVKKSSQGSGWFYIACPSPRDELGQIHPSIGGLAVVNPALRLPQSLAQITLR